ncbi:hypothetical protein MMC20_003204 [Loxospora ochrophaea]|nr:hypothetical protein [Loxospora ochrophaea]
MAPADDLKSHATSTTDFYALLSLPASFSQSELDRAWRKTALKYHPDKVGPNDVIAKEKFHLAQIGYDVLSDPAVRALYDAGRQARERKERERELMGARRREDREKLERRERMGGVKRPWGETEAGGEEERLEREVTRLAEDGRRRREERERELRSDALRQREAEAEATRPDEQKPTSAAPAPTEVAEIDRTVTVRWTRAGAGSTIDKARLITLLSAFGAVEHATEPKDKPKKKGKTLASAAAVYKSVVGAHAAVADWEKQSGEDWDAISYVFWTAKKEPDFLQNHCTAPRDTPQEDDSSAPSTPLRNGSSSSSKPDIHAFLRNGNGTSTPQHPHAPSSANGAAAGPGPGVRKVPSFASFSQTPTASPSFAGRAAAVGSPSLEELTMIRLKNAERRRVEGERRRREEDVGDGGDRLREWG